MLYQTTIPVGGVEEKELRSLAEQLSRISGQRIEMQLQFVISTESVELTTMLDALKETIVAGRVRKISRRNGHKPRMNRIKKEIEMGSRSMRNTATKEIVSTATLKKQVAAGQIEELTTFENSRGDQFVVIERKLMEGPQP
jgi:hypothetical protein